MNHPEGKGESYAVFRCYDAGEKLGGSGDDEGWRAHAVGRRCAFQRAYASEGKGHCGSAGAAKKCRRRGKCAFAPAAVCS